MELKVPEAPQGQQVRLPTNGKLQHGDSKSSFSLDIAGEADDHVNIRVADWSGHVSILHPCGRLEWPCFHIISVWLTGAATFPYYIHVADWSGHVSHAFHGRASVLVTSLPYTRPRGTACAGILLFAGSGWG